MKALFASEAEANHVYPLLSWNDLYPRFQALWATGSTGGSASGE
jgi:hypothetical protein